MITYTQNEKAKILKDYAAERRESAMEFQESFNDFVRQENEALAEMTINERKLHRTTKELFRQEVMGGNPARIRFLQDKIQGLEIAVQIDRGMSQ